MRTQTIRRSRRGFTLIEILIVVVILGILAAIVIPQFTEASDDAEAQSARSTLQTVRSQFELCRFKGDCSDCGDYDGVDSGSSNIVGDLVDNGYLTSTPELQGGYAWTLGSSPCAILLNDPDGNATGW